MKGALSYLNECIVDRYEEDLKNPSAYSWEGGNYSRGYSPHLVGWSGETGECARSLSRVSSEVPTGYRAHCLRVEGPAESEYTRGHTCTQKLPNPRRRLQLRSPGRGDTLPGESVIDGLH